MVGSASPWAATSARATQASCSSTFASVRNEEGIRRINATWASQLKRINPGMIVAVGHADRLGSSRDNQRL
jgi:hypothetical protein